MGQPGSIKKNVTVDNSITLINSDSTGGVLHYRSAIVWPSPHWFYSRWARHMNLIKKRMAGYI